MACSLTSVHFRDRMIVGPFRQTIGDRSWVYQRTVRSMVTGFPEVVGVLWSGGKIIDLGTLGGAASWAGTINDQGQVAGAALNDVPDSFSGNLAIGPLFPVTTQLHAFLWEHGVMKDLGTLGGPDSEAQYINARGQIAGQSFTDFTPNPPVTAPACLSA